MGLECGQHGSTGATALGCRRELVQAAGGNHVARPRAEIDQSVALRCALICLRVQLHDEYVP
jgi:hypothetical protein